MRSADVRTVLAFLQGAQTIAALYQSPDGPTDPETGFVMVSAALEAKPLLEAQLRLQMDMGQGAVLVLQPDGLATALPVYGSQFREQREPRHA